MTIEEHPLEPFLPEKAKILFLGSFPPPKARWSMEFFYPNWINDFWRIQGLIHFADKHYFEATTHSTEEKSPMKRFDKEKIIASLEIEMKEAARVLNFEKAAELRDIILEIKAED